MNKLIFIFVVMVHTSRVVSAMYLSFETPTDVFALIEKYLPSNPVIVEAGAYNGNDSVNMICHWPQAVIHSFEPIPQLYAQLCNKTKNYPPIHTYCMAIGEFVGIGKMHVSEEGYNPGMPSQSSSLLEPKEHLRYAPTTFPYQIDVVVKTFDHWANEYNVDHVDFMWLDMQGYELNALKASPRILSTVRALVTEVEFVEAYKDQYLFDDVKKWLEDNGFTMIAQNTSCGWFGDALFVRTSLLAHE